MLDNHFRLFKTIQNPCGKKIVIVVPSGCERNEVERAYASAKLLIPFGLLRLLSNCLKVVSRLLCWAEINYSQTIK
jgi:hypothetical protein